MALTRPSDGYISTHADVMPNGVDTALVQVSAQGLDPRISLVKLTVQSGLSQIGVKVSGKSFSYSQGNLQPAFQTLTITNTSTQNFAWSIQYSESNSWLVMTPIRDQYPQMPLLLCK